MLRRSPILVVILWLLAVPAILPAQERGEEPAREPLSLYGIKLEHQSASEALELVRPLLSERGTVKLEAGGTGLEVRDTTERITRIRKLLQDFDHPVRHIELEVMVVRATTAPPVSPKPPAPPEIPEELVRRWRNLLRYEYYVLEGHARLEPREGEEVVYDLGGGYRVGFRLGTLLGNRRIKLTNFRLTRKEGSARRELIHTHLNPWLDQSVALGLARDEGSQTALMVVVVCRQPELWEEEAPEGTDASSRRARKDGESGRRER